MRTSPTISVRLLVLLLVFVPSVLAATQFQFTAAPIYSVNGVNPRTL
jgi:hypothetical protein